MPESPISAVIRAINALDVDRFTSLFEPDGRLLTTDGRVAQGVDQVRAVIGEFVSALRACTHVVDTEWHPEGGVWIAEVDATYELKDRQRRGPYPRAIVLRGGSGGIVELRVYGLHELPLTEPTHRYQEVPVGQRWLATL
jgi:hypothetical protein